MQIPGGIVQASPSPDRVAFHRLDIRLDDPVTGRWQSFLSELWPDDVDSPRTLQEALGTALLGRPTDFAKCLILLGDGANGKSILLQALRDTIFPPGMSGCVPPQLWHREYYLLMLRHLRLNIVSEIPNSRWEHSYAFKMIISGEPVIGREPYGRPEEIHPEALHIFCANELPTAADTTKGFWRRFIILPMTQTFDGSVSTTTLRRELKEDARGILQWALEGAVTARRAGKYHEGQQSVVIQQAWHQDSDSARAFLTCCCILGPQYQTTVGDTYEAYVQWCAASGRQPLSVAWMSRRFGAGVARWRTDETRGFHLKLKPQNRRTPG